MECRCSLNKMKASPDACKSFRKKHAQTYIHGFHSSSGEPVVRSSLIAPAFHNYYSDLYNLDKNLPPEAQAAKSSAICEYLTSSGFPVDRQPMLHPGVPEVEVNVKSMLSGKSPGPDRFTKTYYKTFFPPPVVLHLWIFQFHSRGWHDSSRGTAGSYHGASKGG